MTKPLSLLLISTVPFVASCIGMQAGGRWVKDVSQQQVNEEHYQCMRDASYRETSTVFAPAGQMLVGVPVSESKMDQRIYNECMRAKGYRWVTGKESASRYVQPVSNQQPKSYQQIELQRRWFKDFGETGGAQSNSQDLETTAVDSQNANEDPCDTYAKASNTESYESEYARCRVMLER